MAIITFILLIGSSSIYTINTGLTEFFKSNITGDFVISEPTSEIMSIFGGVTPGIDEFIDIETLTNYTEIIDALTEVEGITYITSQITGNAVLDVGKRHFPVTFFGIESSSYFNFFEGVDLIEGSISQNKEPYIFLNIDQKKKYEILAKKELNIGDELLLNVQNGSGFKIQNVFIKGFYSYSGNSEALNNIVFVDPDSARYIKSILEETEVVAVENSNIDLLDYDLESFFDSPVENSFFDDLGGSDVLNDLYTDDEVKSNSLGKVNNTWNFILIKTNNKLNKTDIENHLNLKLSTDSYNILTWRQAAGQSAILSSLIVYFFIGGFLLALFAAGIGIVNVITISIINRTPEFGTIRAIGGQKIFILKLVILEISLLCLIGGILGILCGTFTISELNSMKIILHNDFFSLMFNGDVLVIKNSKVVYLTTFLFSLIFGIVSSISPIVRAVSITPLKALNEV